jgi:hypothetical protein
VVVGASEERLWTGQGASNLLMEGGDWFTWGTREQWVIVDLRQLQAVHSVEFSMWGNAGNPQQIGLQVPSTLTPLSGGDYQWERVSLVDIPSASSTDYTAYLPQRTHARYWRVYLHNNWGGNWGMGLRRLQFQFEAQSHGHTHKHTGGSATSDHSHRKAEQQANDSVAAEAVQVLGGMRRTDLGLLCLCTVLALMLIWTHVSRIVGDRFHRRRGDDDCASGVSYSSGHMHMVQELPGRRIGPGFGDTASESERDKLLASSISSLSQHPGTAPRGLFKV